jgi:hypothetical protein
MKTKNFPLIAAILLSIATTNAFAVLRSPFPAKPCSPDRVMVIGDGRNDSIRITPTPNHTSK